MSATSKSFVDDTADKLGVDPRTVRRELQTAKNLTPEAKEIIKGTTPNSLKASMLSGMALFVKTYETELHDRVFIRRMSLVSPDEIIRLGRIETDVGLRFARIILDKYNGGGAELPYRFKR